MSIIAYDASSHFPIQNLPYGVFSRRGQSERRICTAIGDYVVDLAALSEDGQFPSPVTKALQQVWTLHRPFMWSEIYRYADAELQLESISHDMTHCRVQWLSFHNWAPCCVGNTQRIHGARQATLDAYPPHS